MDDECREVIEAISTLSSGESSGNEKDICSTISNVEEYLNRLLLNDRRKFNMAYVAICTKIFELTCDIPYQRLSWLVHVGVSTEVFNALCTCLATSSLQGSHVIQQLAKDYCSSRLKEMLWSEQPDEQTLTNLINMPQLLGNRLQLDLDEYFIPKTFYTTLISVVCDVLMKCHTAISTASHDYALSHISYLVSKIITSGYHDAVNNMISYLDIATSKDMIWQRISCALINHLSVPAVDTFVECILQNTKPSLMSSSATCHILGNCLLTQRRLSHTLCHRCLLVRCSDEPWLLYNIAGYLLSSILGRQLLLKALLSLLKVWSDISLVRHLDYPQLLHISRAIVLFTCCLSDNDMLSSETCSDVFHQLMQGMEHHMTNPVINQRLLAMRLAECVSQKIIKDGSPLKFDIDENDETKLLSAMSLPITEQEKQLHNNVDHVIQPVDNVVPAVGQPKVMNAIKIVDDDDDDDDLIPFDTTPQSHRNVPHYLREVMSGILEGSPNDRLELLKTLPTLIKSRPYDLDEVCEELCKVVLHWAGCDEENKARSKEALVTLLSNCPLQAANYLTEQFHCHGYSIEQRLFILEVLSLSSLQLSNSHDTKGANQFIPVAGYFFFPLMKYFKHKDKDELVIAHVIHTLTHVIHCVKIATVTSKMSEHLLEVVLEYRSHPSAFIRQSTLCSITIILSTSAMLHSPAISIREWLEDVINNDNDHQCRSLATDAIKLL